MAPAGLNPVTRHGVSLATRIVRQRRESVELDATLAFRPAPVHASEAECLMQSG